MRELRFARQGEDRDHVIVESADGEQFRLLVDVAMRDAARSDLPRLHQEAPEPEPPIGPREIQMRVRAGESPEDVAEANGMSLERVMRFAGPVLDERSRVAFEARRARARRGAGDGTLVVFGEAVDERFDAHGISPFDVRWDSRRRGDGHWIICAGWVGGDAERTAEWLFQVEGRSVTPLDETAADLLSDRPIRPITPPVPERASLAAAPALAPGVVAFPAMPDAHTGPIPGIESERDDGPGAGAAGEHGEPGHRTGTARATGRPAAARGNRFPPAADEGAEQAATFDAPPLPLTLVGTDDQVAAAQQQASRSTSPLPRVTNLGVAAREGLSDEERAERARIPSWDDILMGVRRKGD